MRAQQRQRMDQSVDRAQRPLVLRVEPDDDTRDGTWAEADAHEVPRSQCKAVRNLVRERARGSAQAGEDRDLGGAGGHRS